MSSPAKTQPKIKKGPSKYITQLPLLFLCLPVVIYLTVFHYLPISGVVIAFKDYFPIDGIFGSEWVGLRNFEYFFQTDAASVLGKTVAYNLVFIFLGIILGVVVALLLFEVNNKTCIKYFQTTMALPRTISYVIAAYIVYALLSYDNGILNNIIVFFGGEPITWYNEPKYWPVILTLTSTWMGVGMGSVLYYGTLMGIDSALFEAAAIDGAGRFRQIIHISLPALAPIVCIMLITSIGGVLGGNQALFYQIPRDSAALYPTTDVLATYLQRGVLQGNLSVTAAVGLFQNMVGLILVLVTNGIVRKISPENSFF